MPIQLWNFIVLVCSQIEIKPHTYTAVPGTSILHIEPKNSKDLSNKTQAHNIKCLLNTGQDKIISFQDQSRGVRGDNSKLTE